MAGNRITAAITRKLLGERPIKALLDPYNPTGSTSQHEGVASFLLGIAVGEVDVNGTALDFVSIREQPFRYWIKARS